MRAVRHVVAALLVLCLVVPAVAQQKQKKEGKQPAVAKQAQRAKQAKRQPGIPILQRLLEGVTLSEEQQAKLKELKEKFGLKFQDLKEQKQAVLSAEQIKAMAEAKKAATEAGKKGKELAQAAMDAVQLTDEQKTKLEEIQQATQKLQQEVREALLEILTDEQKAALQDKLGRGQRKGARRQKGQQ